VKDILINIENDKIIQSLYKMKNYRGQLLMLQIFIYGAPTIQKILDPSLLAANHWSSVDFRQLA
jgi:hypothetical protein